MSGGRIGRAQWIILISAQAASGMSVAAFCKRRKLPLATFYQWRKKLAVASEPDGDQAVIDIELRCGATIRLPLASEDTMRRVLSTLIDLGHER